MGPNAVLNHIDFHSTDKYNNNKYVSFDISNKSAWRWLLGPFQFKDPAKTRV